MDIGVIIASIIFGVVFLGFFLIYIRSFKETKEGNASHFHNTAIQLDKVANSDILRANGSALDTHLAKLTEQSINSKLESIRKTLREGSYTLGGKVGTDLEYFYVNCISMGINDLVRLEVCKRLISDYKWGGVSYGKWSDGIKLYRNKPLVVEGVHGIRNFTWGSLHECGGDREYIITNPEFIDRETAINIINDKYRYHDNRTVISKQAAEAPEQLRKY